MQRNRRPIQLSLWPENEVRDGSVTSDEHVIAQALSILAARYAPGETIASPGDVRRYLRLSLAGHRAEVFVGLYLDNRHRVLDYTEHFQGSIDHTAVHPRVIAQHALEINAAAVIFAHNHPSGIPEPSDADRLITRRLIEALEYFDVRVLDHFVVGADSVVSLAERGLLH